MLLLEEAYHRHAVIRRVGNGDALYSDIYCMHDVDRSVSPEVFIVDWRIGIVRVRQKVPRKSSVAKNPGGKSILSGAKAETKLHLMLQPSLLWCWSPLFNVP